MVYRSYRSYRGYNYDPAYTSHAHGWSSAPTSTLTTYILGLGVMRPMGKEWVVKPVHVPGLSSDSGVRGGFETPLGWFGVDLLWVLNGETTGVLGLEVRIETPVGTIGEFVVPRVFGSSEGVEVRVDGVVWVKDPGLSGVVLSGGVHSVSVRVDI